MKKIILTALFMSFFIVPNQSLALSCVEPSPPDVAYDEYDAVIIGEVKKIKETLTKKMVTVEVAKSFKGVEVATIKVEEDITWGTSQLGTDYLYFLNRDGDDWVHPLCSPTTDNTALAEAFLADKEEIDLQDLDRNGSMNRMIMALTALSVASAALVYARSSRKKK